VRKRPLDARVEGAPAGCPANQDERVVRHPDERRREHGGERDIVVPVSHEREVREQVGDLLLAEVAPTRRAIRRQAGLAKLVLVRLCCGSGSEEEHDLARACRAGVDELADAPCDAPGFGPAPVGACLAEARLVGNEQLDRVSEHRLIERPSRCERLELLAERRGEQVVDGVQHRAARPVVPGQREDVRGRRASFAERRDIRMAEAVDRLELVPDVEHLRVGAIADDEVDDLALEAIRVLELVDHDDAKALLLGRADRGVVAQQTTGGELQVLEVEHRLP
jgi:hypothetical protein